MIIYNRTQNIAIINKPIYMKYERIQINTNIFTKDKSYKIPNSLKLWLIKTVY
jgi:hypothetical protein